MPSTREPETALDYWLRTALRDRYGEAVREPMPEVLTRLLAPAPDRVTC